MKLTNILSIFVLLAVTISCSMDDETVFNDMDKEIQNSLESYAYFNIGMNGGDIATKTSSATDGGTENPDDVNSTESSVWGVFVAITYGDKVLTSYYYSSEKNEIVALSDSYSFQLKGHMFVKVPAGKPTMTCYAVANVRGTEVADLSAQTTLTAIKNVLLSEQANILPKEGSYDLSGYKTTSKLLHTPVTDGNGYTEDRIMEDGVDKCNNVKINLSQRAVAVELAKFKVRTKKGDTYEDLDFTVDSVALLNGKQMTRVASEYEGLKLDYLGMRNILRMILIQEQAMLMALMTKYDFTLTKIQVLQKLH